MSKPPNSKSVDTGPVDAHPADSQAADPLDPVVELEIRAAYQDKLIADLDEVIQGFAARVQRLEREVKELRERVDDGPEAGPHDAAPPHY